MLYSRTLLFIYSIYNSLHVLTQTPNPSLSQPPLPWQPQIWSLQQSTFKVGWGRGSQGLCPAWAQFSVRLMHGRRCSGGEWGGSKDHTVLLHLTKTIVSAFSISIALSPAGMTFFALILLRIFCDPWICGLSFMNFEKYYIFKYLFNPSFFPMALQSHVKLDHLTESHRPWCSD